jgi:purine-nucleoside phosphorylase
MSEYFSLSQIEQIVGVIQTQLVTRPRVAIILGSGLGGLATTLHEPQTIPYSSLPSFPVSTVEGHIGRFVIGDLEGQPVMVMQGRVHYYEGYSMAEITLPIRVMHLLGVEVLIVTNAAGAVNPNYEPGDVMLITDHLNLIGMAGLNPLRGPNLDTFGPRFPDMGQAYDRGLAQLARQVAAQNYINLQEGVYCCLAGPTFETPADLRFLRAAGVDAVGMSTVPEVIVAHHAGMRALGLSGISNKANLDGNTLTTHEEVLAAGQLIVPKLESLVRGILRSLD